MARSRRLARTLLCAVLLAGGPASAAPEPSAPEPEAEGGPPPGEAERPPDASEAPPRQPDAAAETDDLDPGALHRPSPDDVAPRADEAAAPPPRHPGAVETWVDVGHAFVEQRLFAPILRLDRFFSDEREIEAERARSFLRWRSEMRLDADRSRPVFTTGVRATLRLPGLNKRLERLRVVIAGETRDAVSTLFPGDGGEEDAPTAEEEDLGRGDAGLRLRVWESLVSHADLGGGVLLHLPPGAYTRLRFRAAVPLGSAYLVRTALTGFWRTDAQGFGTTLAADVERLLSARLVARLASSATLSQGSLGVDWTGDLAVLAALGRRAGAQVGVAIDGQTDAPRALDRPRAYARFRRDFHRRWLFFEVEPEVAWPWTAERGRHAAWGLAFRLEVQFRGTEAPPSPPPHDASEPKDPPAAERSGATSGSPSATEATQGRGQPWRSAASARRKSSGSGASTTSRFPVRG